MISRDRSSDQDFLEVEDRVDAAIALHPLREKINQVIASLSRRQAQVLELRVVSKEGEAPLSRPEVGRRLGISKATVRTHEIRGLAKLRKI